MRAEGDEERGLRQQQKVTRGDRRGHGVLTRSFQSASVCGAWLSIGAKFLEVMVVVAASPVL